MALRASGLYSRLQPILPELVKFCVVGGIGTVIDLGGAALLHGKYHVEPLAAKAASTAAATVVTYLGSRFWTFKHRENQELKREAVLFVVLNLVGLLIAEIVVGFVTYVLNLHSQLEYNAASVIGTGLATIFRYFAYKRWVFLAPVAGPATGSAETAELPDYPPWEFDPAYAAAEVSTQAPVTTAAQSSPWGETAASSSPAAEPVPVEVEKPPLYSWEPTEHLPQPDGGGSAPRRSGRHRRNSGDGRPQDPRASGNLIRGLEAPMRSPQAGSRRSE